MVNGFANSLLFGIKHSVVGDIVYGKWLRVPKEYQYSSNPDFHIELKIILAKE